MNKEKMQELFKYLAIKQTEWGIKSLANSSVEKNGEMNAHTWFYVPAKVSIREIKSKILEKFKDVKFRNGLKDPSGHIEHQRVIYCYFE